MAALKVFLLAFLACSALVNTEAASLQRNIVDDFEKFLEFEKLVEETANKYLHLLEEVVETVTETINNQLDKTFEEIKNALETFEKLQQDVQKYGEEFEKCATKQYPKIQQLFDEIETTQAACVKDSNQAVEAIKARLNEKLNAIREEVAVVIGEIQACKNVDCLREGGKKLLEKVEVVKGYVKEALKEVVAVVQETSPQAVSCVVAASDKFQVEMKKVYAEIQQCTKA